MRYILSLLLVLIWSKTEAQTIYALTGIGNVYTIENDYSVNYICSLSNIWPADIAVSPNGSIYVIYNNQIYQIDPSNGIETLITTLPNGYHTSLTCSNNYELYSISEDGYLYKYSLLSDSLTNLGDIGFNSLGDITFYKGNLIFPTQDELGKYMIKAYNLGSEELVDIFCGGDNYDFMLWGLAIQYTNCSNNIVLGVNMQNELLYIDLSNNTYTKNALNIPDDEMIFGIASTNEHLGSLCTPENLTDLDCENLSNNYLAYNKPFIYPTFVENQLFWENFDEVTTVSIYDITGKIIFKKEETSITSIVVDNLEKGIYILKLESKNGSFTQKFIKK